MALGILNGSERHLIEAAGGLAGVAERILKRGRQHRRREAVGLSQLFGGLASKVRGSRGSRGGRRGEGGWDWF